MTNRRYIKICDAFATDRAVDMGTKLEIFRGYEHDNDLIELGNDTWLKSYNDGRYTTDGDESERWATVQIIEEDEEGDIISAEYLGFVRL